MSLLLDALRQAEQQKQQGKEFALPGQAGNSALALEPRAGPGTPLPELPARLEDLDDQFVTTGAAPKKTGRAPTQTPETDAPRPLTSERPVRDELPNAVRQQPTPPAVGYPFTLIAAIVGVVALAGMSAHFYWQMPVQSSLVPPAAEQNPAAAPAPRPQPAQSEPMPPPARPPAHPEIPAPPPVARTPSPDLPPSMPAAAVRAPTPEPPLQTVKPPEIAFRPGAQTLAPSLRIVEAAYTAYMQGELILARTLWWKALQIDPLDLHALHGLAAIALRDGRTEEAAVLYRRALEADPHDAVAHAGLLPLEGIGDPRQTEIRLKRLLAEQPDSPHLNFALANVFASQARWAEAQQVYFKAHVIDPGNPDYLYNLAVSLDYLHQPGLAERFYARALTAAGTRPAAFDPAAAAARLREAPAGNVQ